MPRTIGNPLSWGAQAVGATGAHVSATAQELGSGLDASALQIRKLTMDDLRWALRAGWEDLLACRSDAMFLVVVYPVIGLALMGFGFNMNLIPLMMPLLMGFALLGPVAAVGLYELSRRREAGQSTGWFDALGVIRAPSFGAVVMLGIYLAVIFLVWMLLAAEIYGATLGPEPPVSTAAFVRDTFTTAAGWWMIVIGMGTGFVLALVVLAISVVSFPLLLDRKVGLPVAIVTSVRVARANPRVILAWGVIVAVGLALGSIPFLLGLIFVLPVLGHGTWHLYRRAVALPPAATDTQDDLADMA